MEGELCRGGQTPNGSSSGRQLVLTLKCPVTLLTAPAHCWLQDSHKSCPELNLFGTEKYIVCPEDLNIFKGLAISILSSKSIK